MRATNRHAELPLIAFESHDESLAVAEWGTKSVFDQTTVSPVATVSSAGTNAKFLIATVCARGAGREQATAPARHASAAVRCQVERVTYFDSDAWMLLARSR